MFIKVGSLYRANLSPMMFICDIKTVFEVKDNVEYYEWKQLKTGAISSKDILLCLYVNCIKNSCINFSFMSMNTGKCYLNKVSFPISSRAAEWLENNFTKIIK